MSPPSPAPGRSPNAGERRLAAIDLGTNSFHLVVVRSSGDGKFEVIGNEKESVRLGSGAGDLEEIAPDAMERGLAALSRFARIARSQGADIRAVATSAVREARNKDEFLRRVRETIGLEIEVIPGKEEARLIYLGILQALPHYDRRMLIIDIGGGSTELLVGKAGQPEFLVSHKLGAIRLKDRFFLQEPLRESMVAECRRFIRAALAGSADQIRALGFEVCAGSSGTIETLARMAQMERERERQKERAEGAERDEDAESLRDLRLTREDLQRAVQRILQVPTHHRRARLPGLDEKRADIIVGGAILLEEIFEVCGIEELEVSPYALREGVIFDSLVRRSGPRSFFPDIRRSSVRHLAERLLGQDNPMLRSSEHIAFLAVRLFDELMLRGLTRARTIQDSLLLESAALLHNVGAIISHSAHHKHSYYIIKNAENLMGFSGIEREIIAQTARYHRKSAPSKKHAEFWALSSENRETVQLFAGILRVAVGLDRSMKQLVPNLHARIDGRTVRITAEAAAESADGRAPGPAASDSAGADIELELWSARNRSELLARSLGFEIEIESEAERAVAREKEGKEAAPPAENAVAGEGLSDPASD